LSLPFFTILGYPGFIFKFFGQYFCIFCTIFHYFQLFFFLLSEVPDSGRPARPREHVLYLKERLNTAVCKSETGERKPALTRQNPRIFGEFIKKEGIGK
jgi:hypothetical protein